MTLRSLFLFIHVLSSMGVFGALVIEATFLLRLREVTDTTQLQAALNAFRLFRIFGPLTLMATVMSGMFLVRAVWGWHAAWINVALGSLVLAAVTGVGATTRRLARLQRLGGGPANGPRRREPDCRRDPVLWASFVMRAAIFTGIVFLMTVKPALAESLTVMTTVTMGGIVVSLTLVPTARIGRSVEGRESRVDARA